MRIGSSRTPLPASSIHQPSMQTAHLTSCTAPSNPPHADAQAQLRSPEILTLLCSLLVRLAGQGAPIPLAQQVSGVEALWGLANLTLLVAGQYSTAVLPGGTGSTSARRYAHVMHDARHMADPAAAEAYCRAAAVLLTAAVPAVQCASGAKLVSAGCAAARLWPLAQRPLILQLLTSLEASPCGFELLACVYAGAMELLPDLGKRLSSAGHSSVAAGERAWGVGAGFLGSSLSGIR